MKKINNLVQFIKNHPRAIKIISFLGVLVLIIAMSIKPNGSKTAIIPNTKITPTPSNGSINPPAAIEPFPMPSVDIKWNKTEVDTPKYASTYATTDNLVTIKSKDLLSNKLGFTNDNLQKDSSDMVKIWKKNDENLLMNFTENTLYYHSNKKLDLSNQYYPEETYFLEARKAIQKITNTDFSTTLVNNSLDYFKLNKIFNVPATVNDSTLIRVSFYQSLNNLPVVTRSETGAIITVFLNKKLEIYSMTIINAFLSSEEQSSKEVIPLSEFVNDKKLSVQWIDSSLGEGSNFEIVTSKNISFNQEEVKVGYFLNNNRIIPSYIFKGTFNSGDNSGQKGTFVIPMQKQE